MLHIHILDPTEATIQLCRSCLPNVDPATSALTNIVEVFRGPSLLIQAPFGLEPDWDIRKRI